MVEVMPSSLCGALTRGDYGRRWGEGAARCFCINSDFDEDESVRLLPIPECFICPLSQTPMEDPVMTVDGCVYERSYIEQWIRHRQQHRLNITSPTTNQELPSQRLVSLTALQKAIEAYLAHRPELRGSLTASRSFEEAAQMLQSDLLEKQVMHLSAEDELSLLRDSNEVLSRALNEAEHAGAGARTELDQARERVRMLEGFLQERKAAACGFFGGGRAQLLEGAASTFAPSPLAAGSGPAAGRGCGGSRPSKGIGAATWRGAAMSVLGGLLLVLVLGVSGALLTRGRGRLWQVPGGMVAALGRSWLESPEAPALHIHDTLVAPWRGDIRIEGFGPLPGLAGDGGAGVGEGKKAADSALLDNRSWEEAARAGQGGTQVGDEFEGAGAQRRRIGEEEAGALKGRGVYGGGASGPHINQQVVLLKVGTLEEKTQAALVLGILAATSPENQAAIVRAGAISLLVELLRSELPEARGQAAVALRALATNNTYNKVAIVRAGAIPLLIRLLQADAVEVQEVAAGALQTIADTNSQAEIAQAGALVPLVALLRDERPGVREEAAGALVVLAMNSDNQVAIAQVGAIPILIELLRDAVPSVREQAAAALKNLAAERMDNRLAIGRAGAFAPLADLLRDDLPGVREEALAALRNLASSDPTSELAVEAAAVAAGHAIKEAVAATIGLSAQAKLSTF